jgi:hypothetical protein
MNKAFLTLPAAVAALGTCAGAWAQLAVPPGPYVERLNPSDWTLKVTVNIKAYVQPGTQTQLPIKDQWKFDTTAVVFPMLTGTASSLTYHDATGELRLDTRKVDIPMELLPGYPGGTRLGKWGFTDWLGEELNLDVTIPVTCWDTKFDEARALKVGWPTGPWPDEASSCFKPEWFMDLAPDGKPYDMKPVQELLKRWTGGKEPKSIPPVTLAKYLAGRVQEEFQPSGLGLMGSRAGSGVGLEGINLQPVPETAQRGRGTEFDVVSLLTAVYRTAGLPARTVIGWDIGAKRDKDRNKFLQRAGSARLRAWVEFYLYDETGGTGNWVPVDVIRLRTSSSRAGKLEQPWKFFGTHDELAGIIPFAHQFHPPTTVRAYGSPGFWGWLVTPQPPERAFQTLSFTATSTPTSLEDAKKREEERQKRGGP